jgi:hypothetical protein
VTGKAEGIRQLIALSQAMLAKAEAELWDDVIVLEAERRQLIAQFFLEPIQQDVEVVAAGIQSILAMDEKLMELGALKRFDILQLLQNLDQGKKAVKAYTL